MTITITAICFAIPAHIRFVYLHPHSNLGLHTTHVFEGVSVGLYIKLRIMVRTRHKDMNIKIKSTWHDMRQVDRLENS